MQKGRKWSINSKSVPINAELKSLYDEMSPADYGKINLICDDILQFESPEHYINVVEILEKQVEEWNLLFYEKYGDNDEEQWDYIAEKFDFNQYLPLAQFETIFKTYNYNLRFAHEQNVLKWMDAGMDTPMPHDELVPTIIEQTLFNKYREICIADTIYHLQNNNITVLIPIKNAKLLPEVRKAKTVSDLPEGVITKSSKMDPSWQHCKKNYWYITGEKKPATNKTFSWSFKFSYSDFLNRHVAHSTMDCYELKNNKWKRKAATIALGQSMDIWQPAEKLWCSFEARYIRLLQTPQAMQSRSLTMWLPKGNRMRTIDHESKNSYGAFRYSGYTRNISILNGMDL